MSYADAWQKWFPLIEQGAAVINRRMVELACLREGDRVLDIGTGIGEPALTAACALGDGGQVVAIDHDPEMISRARRRASVEHTRNIDFQIMPAETLRFPVQSFDAVLARWSLMFVDDLPGVCGRVRQVLRPGGRFVLVVWGPPEHVPALSLATTVARECLGLEPLRYGPNTAFALSDVTATADLLAACGFTTISGEWIKVNYTFATLDLFIAFRSDCLASFANLMQRADAPKQNEIRSAIGEGLSRYRLSDGSFRTENWAYCLAARG